MLAKSIKNEYHRDHDDHEADHQPGELVDALVEAGQHALPGDAVRQGTEIGPAAGLDDHRCSRAAFDVGTQEADVGHLQWVLYCRIYYCSGLLHR